MQQQIIDASMDLFQLSYPLETYNATPFTPKQYDVTKMVEGQHQFTRFGHTNNFQAFVSGITNSSDTSTDYILGVCAAAMLVFVVALVWFMVITGLKVAGQKKVGFLAGRLIHPDFDENAERGSGMTLPVIEEEPASEEIESLIESDADTESPLIITADAHSPLLISNNIDIDLEQVKKEKKFNRKVLAVRAVFVLSGISVMVCGILFYAKGVSAFGRSLDAVSSSLNLVQQTANAAINITETLLTDKDQLLNGLNTTKINVGNELLCNGDGAIAENIKSHVKEIEAEVESVNSIIEENVGSLVKDLRQVITIADEVDKKLEAANIFFYITITISVIVIVLILAMLVMTYFSAKGVENCCTKLLTYGLLWPVFIFFLILFWIFALLFLVTSLAGSDFCVKPDQIVEGLLRQYQDQFQSVIFQFAIYYISGCQVLPKTDQIDSMSAEIGEVVDTVHDLSEFVMSQSLNGLESQCGLTQSAATALQGGAGLLHNASHTVNNAWIDVRHFVECKTFNPIYTTLVHDAICVDGVDGLAWLFSSSMFLAVFAMIMITFRAALYPVKRPLARAGNSSLGTSIFL